MFERPGTGRLEKIQGIEILEGFTEELAREYQHEGIPVGLDCRLDMLAYGAVHPDAERDFAGTRESHDDAAAKQERMMRDGERLEMLAHVILAKNLGPDCIVVRSAPHDDWANGVDTVILDRRTGGLVCAFDEVGETKGPEYERKLKTVSGHNSKGGASLKYGIGIENKNNKIRIVPASADHIPLFYIALPKDHIEKGISEFIPESGKQSEFERKLFSYFMATLSAQAQGLALDGEKIHPELRKNLDAFKKFLDDLSLKQERK